MRMDVADALKVFQLYGQEITREVIKKTYRQLAMRYHPDRNPGGSQRMQDINVAYDCLTNAPVSILAQYAPKRKSNYHEEDKFFFHNRGCMVYHDDECLWVAGQTYHWRTDLKARGFRWSPEEKAWWKEY